MLVKESISFQRYKDPKDALFGNFPLKIGDEIVDLGNNHSKIIDIILKQDVFKTIDGWDNAKYPDIEDFLEKYSDDDFFYVAKTDDVTSRGKVVVYPVESKHVWWNIEKVDESIAFQRYKDPKEALGLSAVFHADDLIFYIGTTTRNSWRISSKQLYQYPYILKGRTYKDPEEEIIKLFKKTGYLNIKTEKNNIWYTMEHLYDDGYRFIEFKGLKFDMTEKLD